MQPDEARVIPDRRILQATRHHGDSPVSALALVRGSGLRFARDALGPVLTFYVARKFVGFGAGIAAATALAVGGYIWERGQARSGLSAAAGLGIALVQALAGLSSGRVVGYFAPPLIVNSACGVAFFVSVVVGRPLAGVFAAESHQFPPDVRASAVFRRVCSRISLVWAGYLLLGSAVRLAVLLRGGVDLYVTVNVATGFPLAAVLMAWSMWYFTRTIQPCPRDGAGL